MGFGVGMGVGAGVGTGVGFGVGMGVGAGVGTGVSAMTAPELQLPGVAAPEADLSTVKGGTSVGGG